MSEQQSEPNPATTKTCSAPRCSKTATLVPRPPEVSVKLEGGVVRADLYRCPVHGDNR